MTAVPDDPERRTPPPGPTPQELRTEFLAREEDGEGRQSPPGGRRTGSSERNPNFARDVVRRLSSRPAGNFGRYTLRGEVARGGMGVILRAWDQDLRRDLAMKIILVRDRPTGKATGAGGAARESRGAGGGPGPSWPVSPPTPSADSQALARFLEEAQVTGQLDHPGIVPVHELGVDPQGRCYFTMRLVRGRDLRRILELVRSDKEGWTQTRVLGVMLRVCEAMAYAHAKGVIHRDLKPANIMVGRYGEVYVMDWGLARVIGREDRRDLRLQPSPETTRTIESDRAEERRRDPDTRIVTMDGAIVGTPAYMPPEQAMGHVHRIDRRSDVYSLGAILYHILAGQMPYVPPGARMTARTILARVVEGPPRAVHALAPSAPAELVAICEKAMAREAGERYADTTKMAEDLRAYLEGRVVSAYETGAWPELKKWVQRNRPLAAALAASVLILAGASVATSSLYVRARNSAALARANEAKAVASETKARESEARMREEKDRADREAAAAAAAAAREQAARKTAEAERDAKQRALDDKARALVEVLRLSDVKRLEELQGEEEDLWPAYPEKVAAMESWLSPAGELAARLPEHEASLARLREMALPYTDDDAWEDRQSFPGRDELARLRNEALRLERDLGGGARARDLTRLRTKIEKLSEAREAWRTWRFADTEAQWRHDVLAGLVEGLETFARPRTGTIASVEHRLAFARTIVQRTIQDHRAAWDQAIASIRDRAECPTYQGLEIQPQVGLVPIGRDPGSGLWEFAHLQTGTIPRRDGEGKLIVSDDMGLVLVLIPGGTFFMGAQSADPGAANFDPQANSDESPVRRVALDAFFLSKYEMTQGQWLGFTGENPSASVPGDTFGDKTVTPRNPVEQVSWVDCDRVLSHLGLRLPTEAQWEYAARAGTHTPWWTGKQTESLAAAANLADRSCKDDGGPLGWVYERWDDGHAVHAPAGSFLPNAFGLYDVLGNVWEWCRDGWGGYGLELSDGDGERRVTAARYRVRRGGAWSYPAPDARSASRSTFTPESRLGSLGLRPARALDP